MPDEIDLIQILQKLYAGEAQLRLSAYDDGWTAELGDESPHSLAFARRRFTPDDIGELPAWIETESAKPRAEIANAHSWPKVAYLRVVK